MFKHVSEIYIHSMFMRCMFRPHRAIFRQHMINESTALHCTALHCAHCQCYSTTTRMALQPLVDFNRFLSFLIILHSR
jgi:hypothetical protein